MGTDKRSLLAFALILGFLYLWLHFVAPKPPARTAQTEPVATPTPEVTAAPAASPAKSAAAPAPQRKPETPAPPVVESDEETALWKLTLTSAPGTISELRLKKYRRAPAENSPPVEVIPLRGEEAPYPLLWNFDVGGRTWEDSSAAYAVAERGEGRIVYERELGSDLTVRKTFQWKEDSYLIDAGIELANRSPERLKVKLETALAAGAATVSAPGFFGGLGDPLHLTAYLNQKAVRRTPEEVWGKGKADLEGDIAWAGFDTQYFLLAAIPVEGRWASVRARVDSGTDPATGKPRVERIHATLAYPALELAPHGRQSLRLRLFAGPKDIGVLRDAGAGLDHAIDLGDWLGPVARPILLILRWLHGLVPNYGVAIVLLTVIVRLLLFPLTQIQVKQMQRMQQHKPEMDAIRAKHKNDREAQTREMMNYMRRHKVNPMGGCLPLLAQMPVLFALYRVLYSAIELRHAPFLFWIRDLSAHDPFYVLPVALGAATYVQQKMTPHPGADPAQAMVMKFMPVFFTVIMLKLAAGLNLYILVSTLLGLVQQFWVKRAASRAPLAVGAKASSG